MTLRDGQDAGEMLLDIERRIGELAEKEDRALPIHKARLRGSAPSGKLSKPERLGLSPRRLNDAQTISKHPEVVEKIKAKARANEDIPTRTSGAERDPLPEGKEAEGRGGNALLLDFIRALAS